MEKSEKAFCQEEQVVLLIDEIDKADLEFPNDLLWEMDQMEFYVQETKRRSVQKPSSHRDHHVQCGGRSCRTHFCASAFSTISSSLPTTRSKEIIHAHFRDIDQEILQQAVLTFITYRRVQNLSKKPSTSELIDWLRALLARRLDPSAVSSDFPYLGVLIKKDKDYDQVWKSMRR